MTEPKAETHKNTSFRYSTDKPKDNKTDSKTQKDSPTVKRKISEIKFKKLENLDPGIKKPLPYCREQ